MSKKSSKIQKRKITDLYEKDKHRITSMTKKIQIDDDFILIDYSKTHIKQKEIDKYLKYFCKDIRLENKINDLLTGKRINSTENKKVYHTVCRDESVLNMFNNKDSDKNNLKDECLDTYQELCKMSDLSKKMENGELKGATGKVLNTIVNIGIGGSDLGPRMVCEALQFYKRKDTKVHFISNVDATESLLVFEKIDPETTLFIVVSKTFTTQETIENAKLAKNYLLNRTTLKNCDEKTVMSRHFVAVSSNTEEVNKYGIEKIFKMGGYVGGRYSLWSTVGLSICLYIGFDNFIKLLKGASIMDNHFKTEKLAENIPVMHSIVELFYNNKCKYNNKCILPYDQYLAKFPSYLQQAEMESNGKTARENESSKKSKKTGMVIWGEPGTNSQHSFFQLIHQGTRKILCEFIVGVNSLGPYCECKENHHKLLYSNCIAQTEALMVGKLDKNNLHKNFEGNKPSITIVFSKLTPEVLGALIAMYEHKIYVQGLYWGINSYDQFGVELGKLLAKKVYKDINENGGEDEHDPSTKQLIELIVKNTKKKE